MKKLTLFLAALCLSAPALAMTEPPVNTATQPVPQEEYDALVASNSRVLVLARDNIAQPGHALIIQMQNMAVQRRLLLEASQQLRRLRDAAAVVAGVRRSRLRCHAWQVLKPTRGRSIPRTLDLSHLGPLRRPSFCA